MKERGHKIMLKRKTAAVLAAVMCALFAGNLSVSAYELPHEYWSINDNYANASDSNNYGDIIKYGLQTINLILPEPVNEQTKNILGSRMYDVAFAYFLTGDYLNAAKYFEMYIPYGEYLGWDDGVIIAQNCVKQFTSSMEVYQRTDAPSKTYGVKNEPNGVLYGQVSEQMQSDDSMVLLYAEYGDTGSWDWMKLVLSKAQRQNKAVELALNFPDEGATAKSVSSSDEYLENLYSMLMDYDVPIYLRIGAEFNIWNTKCTPEEFISAFRCISDKMKSLSNVASVWSAAHTSSWKSEDFPYTADDFYPGDSYVDWVGVNCYPTKYFNGKRWTGISQFNEVCYKSGYSADPVLMIKDIADKYGDRKPIMISECGSAYRTNGEVSETDEEWAAYYLKQMYSFIPIVYPQVKLIAYFNKRMDNETSYYDLEGSSKLKSAYNEAIQSPWFIKGSCENSAEAFFKKADAEIVSDGTAELYTYPHLYGSDSISVKYYLDGELIAQTSDVPYKAEISGIRGTHNLKVTAEGNNGASMTREYKITGNFKAEKAEDFSDTQFLSEAQKRAVDYSITKGIITGYENNTFMPDSGITRAEFAAVMCRMMGYDANENCGFEDAKNHWASKYIKACADAGMINGIGGNKFDPDSRLTTEQAVKILTIAYKLADEKTKYPDGFMSAAYENGLFENVSSDKIGENSKRIDVTMMIYNAENSYTSSISYADF